MKPAPAAGLKLGPANCACWCDSDTGDKVDWVDKPDDHSSSLLFTSVTLEDESGAGKTIAESGEHMVKAAKAIDEKGGRPSLQGRGRHPSPLRVTGGAGDGTRFGKTISGSSIHRQRSVGFEKRISETPIPGRCPSGLRPSMMTAVTSGDSVTSGFSTAVSAGSKWDFNMKYVDDYEPEPVLDDYDKTNAIEALIDAGRYAEALGALKRAGLTNDDRYWNMKIMTDRCHQRVQRAFQVCKAQPSEFDFSGITPSSVRYHVKLTDQGMSIIVSSAMHADLATVVAALLEVDLQGGDPLVHSGKWRGRRRVSFQEWMTGEVGTFEKQTSLRGTFEKVKSFPGLKAIRKDLVSVCELHDLSPSSSDTTWRILWKDPIFGRKWDSISRHTAVDLLGICGAFVIQIGGPEEGTVLPPPEEGYNRTVSEEVTWVLVPTLEGLVECHTLIDIEMGFLIGALSQWLPSWVLESRIAEYFDAVKALMTDYMSAKQLHRSMEVGDRKDLYKSVQKHYDDVRKNAD